MVGGTISAEYILYACDDDLDLAEKICRRLDGLRLTFSARQIDVLRIQKALLDGKQVSEIAADADHCVSSIYEIRKKVLSEGIHYYFGDEEQTKKENK